MAQIENHAQPSARPAITSLSQCTSSSTRLPATMTTSQAATPAMAARTTRPRPRVSSSAAAAKKAADHDEWPLGNDGPSVSAIGFSAGRTRSASSLTVVVRMPFPANHDQQEGHDPHAPRTHGLRDGQDDRQRDDHDRLAEMRDGIEAVRRERGRVPVAPIRHALVQLHEISAAAHQVGQHSEEYAATHDHEQREGQRKAGCGPRIKPLGERSAGPGWRRIAAAGLARRAQRRRHGRARRARPAPHHRGQRPAPAVASTNE